MASSVPKHSRRVSPATIIIILVSLGLIALLWAVLLSHARSEKEEAVAAAVTATENRAEAFEQYVIRTLERADALTVYLIEHFGSLEGNRQAPVQISSAVLERTDYAVASIVDEQGYVIASTASLPKRPLRIADTEIFETHASGRSDGLVIGKPLRSRLLGQALISFTRRIEHPDGSFAGIVGVQLSPRLFTELFGQAEVGPRDLVSVVGLDGITRARRTGQRESFGEDLSGLPAMRMQARKPDGTYHGPGGLDGIVRYVSYRTLDDYPLFVSVGVPEEDAMALTERHFRSHLVGAVLLTLLILLLAALLINGLRRRQSAALEIMEANSRLREAQRIGRIGNWSYDLESGAVHWSDQLFAMYERDLREGSPSYEEVLTYFDTQSRVATKQAVKTAIETGQPQLFEQKVHLPSGKISYHQTVAVVETNESGKAVRLHGTDQDISSRKLIENLQAEIAHMSRIDAMNTMAATLAHELNQPLTAAANYLAGAKRISDRKGGTAGTNVREGMDQAEKQIRLAGDIIRRVRGMIADRSAHHERARLSEIIGDASALVSMASGSRDLSLQVDLDPNAEHVRADVVQVQQVLVNLIRNACDATKKGTAPRIRITSRAHAEGEVRICVEDNGTGIPDEVKDLFSTFSTSKEGGLGIGLSISRTIVEAHGGSIWVEATGPAGTTICFTLPADAYPADGASQKGSSPK